MFASVRDLPYRSLDTVGDIEGRCMFERRDYTACLRVVSLGDVDNDTVRIRSCSLSSVQFMSKAGQYEPPTSTPILYMITGERDCVSWSPFT